MGRENSGQEDVGGQPRFPGARTGVTLPLLVISGLATGPRQGRATGFDSSLPALTTLLSALGAFCLWEPSITRICPGNLRYICSHNGNASQGADNTSVGAGGV